MTSAETPAFVRDYLARFDDTWADDTPQELVRFVVLDSETTGLDPKKDSIITIGAVAVENNQVLLDDAFEAMLKIAFNTASVTVHGITRDQAREGMEEPEALEQFLDYLKDGVIVGHHIMHDVQTFNTAYQRHWGFELKNRSLDTMDLTLHIERDGAFSGQEKIRGFSLDNLCTLFGIKAYDRHTAAGDAFVTAMIFLRLLAIGKRFNRATLGALAEPFVPEDS
jgi:DNA polymerase-3 subunit epsilon